MAFHRCYKIDQITSTKLPHRHKIIISVADDIDEYMSNNINTIQTKLFKLDLRM
jgi:hypothetical protein